MRQRRARAPARQQAVVSLPLSPLASLHRQQCGAGISAAGRTGLPARAHAPAALPPVLRQPQPQRVRCALLWHGIRSCLPTFSSRPRTRRKMCASATTGGASPRPAPRKLPWRPPTPTPRLRLRKLGAPLPPGGFDIVRPPPETQSRPPRSRQSIGNRATRQGRAARVSQRPHNRMRGTA